MSSAGPPEASVRALERFVAAVPGADGVLDAHRADNGEVLPHVLMADLRRFFVSAVESGEGRQVAAFLAGVEELASSPDEDVRNVVDVSFIEDLVQGADERERAAIEAMRPLLGPASAQSLSLSERHVS